MTAFEGADRGEMPILLVAVTVKVKAVPLLKPVIVAVVAPVVVTIFPPGLAVTVYPVVGEPPLLAGAVQDTTARAFPGVALTPLGAPGAVFAAGSAQSLGRVAVKLRMTTTWGLPTDVSSRALTVKFTVSPRASALLDNVKLESRSTESSEFPGELVWLSVPLLDTNQ